MQPNPQEIPPSVGIQAALTQSHIDDWLQNDVFHVRWWILLLMLLSTITAWFFLLDKTKARAVCLFASICAVFSMGIREYGEELILWDYPVDIIPVFPPLTSINLLIVPLAYSLLYQRYPTRKGFLLSALVCSAAISFILEPLLSWGGFFELVNWQYYLNFPMYFITALFTRYLTLKFVQLSGNAKKVSGHTT